MLGRRRECYDAQVSARRRDGSLRRLAPAQVFFLGVLHSQRMKVNIRFIVHRNISGAAWRSGDASRFRKPRRIESRRGFRGGSDRRAAAPSLSPTPAVRICFASSSKTSRLARDKNRPIESAGAARWASPKARSFALLVAPIEPIDKTRQNPISVQCPRCRAQIVWSRRPLRGGQPVRSTDLCRISMSLSASWDLTL